MFHLLSGTKNKQVKHEKDLISPRVVNTVSLPAWANLIRSRISALSLQFLEAVLFGEDS